MLNKGKKFQVIEEGIISKSGMKKVLGGTCSSTGMYGCNNDNPASLVISACFREKLVCTEFLNCPVSPDNRNSTCGLGGETFTTCSCTRYEAVYKQ